MAAALESYKQKLSFNDAVDIMGDFLEVSLSTILYLRGLYPPALFARVKAYEVPVYQCRHPQVRHYIAGFVRGLLTEMKKGSVERITFLIKSASTNAHLERYIFELSYMELKKFRDEGDKGVALNNSPSQSEMRLMLQAFLTRLTMMEGQLVPLDPEDATFVLMMTMKSGSHPDLRPVVDYNKYQGKDKKEDRIPVHRPDQGPSLWAPAPHSDLPLHQRPTPADQPTVPPKVDRKGKGKARADDAMEVDGTAVNGGGGGDAREVPSKGEEFRAVSSVETGIVDINLMVQECAAKRKKVFYPSLPD